MQTKLTDKQATSAKFEVTVPAAEVDRAFDSVLRVIARQVRVPGFRPGKAPRGVLVKRVGEDALAQEVRDALVEANYPKAVEELELTPVHAHFHAHEPNEGNDYTFEVHVDLYPDFELPDLGEIIIDAAAPDLTEDMVEEAVAELQREHATLVPVERPVQAGDYVLVETLSDGEPSGNVLPIDLERVDPDLVEQLLGKAMGDEVELTFGGQDEKEATEAEAAEGDANEDEKSSAATQTAPNSLTVTIKDVKEKEKPEADDELAATLGFETWDEVLAQIRNNLQAQLESEAFEAQREEFIDKLVAETEVELPTSLVNRRKANLLNNLAQDLKGRGTSLEGYIASLDAENGRETFENDLQESAEDAVRRDLVLEKLLDARGTEVSDQEFSDALRYMASRQGKEVGKFRSEMGDEWLENYRFLLARDKAVREVVREKVGPSRLLEQPEEAAPHPEAEEGSSETAEAVSE